MQLFLLGAPRILRAGASVELASRKAVALLAYLAVTGQTHMRAHLVTLLWPDYDDQRGRATLRNALWVLNNGLGHDLLVTTRHTIALDPAAGLWVDSREFAELALLPLHLAPEDAILRLQAAAALYQDDFMTGFTLRDSLAFDDWQRFQSEELRRSLALVLAHLADLLNAQGSHQEAISHARRLVGLDPLHEESQRQLIRLYAAASERNLALRQYEQCVRLLADELGVAPQAETRKLFEDLRLQPVPATAVAAAPRGAGTGPPPLPPPTAPDLGAPLRRTGGASTLPVQPTHFVGRASELAHIRGLLLDDPDCRLLTILGPGGVGKSRLALQAAAYCLDAFTDGVHFISLAPVADAVQAPTAIAEALNAPPRSNELPERYLIDFLRNRDALIVLDNFEHVIAAAGLVADILASAPEVKVLITSRQRLNLRSEWVFQLEGLEVPETAEVDNPDDYSALRLFKQSALRSHPGFDFAARQPAAIIRICQMLEGLPLGIELAAGWTRVLSSEEIARTLAEDPSALRLPSRDAPPRHHSLQAVFEHSWHLLEEEERQALMRLAVFRGGFDLEAARHVAGANAPILMALLDKSLIRPKASGRFAMHSLIYQFATARLEAQPAIQQRVRGLHSRYFAGLVNEREADFHGANEREALAWMIEESENIRRAWQWAVTRADADLVGQFIEAFLYFFDIQSRYQECIDWTDAAIAVFAAIPAAPGPDGHRRQSTLGRLQALNAGFQFRIGNFSAALERSERALSLLEAHGPIRDRGHACIYRGAASYGLGDLEDAVHYFLAAASAYRQAGHRWGVGASLQNAGFVKFLQGERKQGLQLALEAVAIGQELNNRYLVSGTSEQLCMMFATLGDRERARQYERLCVQALAELDRPYVAANMSLTLSDIAAQAGEYETAIQHMAQAVAIARRTGNRFDLSRFLTRLGAIHLADAATEAARAALLEALRLAQAIEGEMLAHEALIGLAGLAAIAGLPGLATELLSFTATHGLAAAEAQDRTEQLLFQLERDTAADDFATARRSGERLTLQQAIGLALTLAEPAG